jgi:hypothetical protein
MRSRTQTAPHTAPSGRPEIFMVRDHALSITCLAEERWTVSVDGGPVPGTFRTRAVAWEAGVRATATQEKSQPVPVHRGPPATGVVRSVLASRPA